MSAANSVAQFLLAAARSLVGGIICFTGWQLLQGEGLLGGSGYGDPLVALFVIIVGLYAIYRGVVVWAVAQFHGWQQKRR